MKVSPVVLKGMLEAADVLAPPPDPFMDDPVGWVKQGGVTWSKQDEILQSVADNRYTAARSCHDVGKSFISASTIAWWIAAHPPGEAFAVSTAPTAPQVEAILWRELNRVHRLRDLPGYLTGGAVPSWKLGNEIVAYGRKPADYDQSAFQGIHAKYVLVVIDEACGVPQGLFEAADALATNELSRVLAIGNPDDPASYFEKICRPGSGWNVVEISAFDWLEEAERMRENDDPRLDILEPLLVSRVWVEERKKRWGETSPVYISKVLGQFPEVTDDTLFTPKMIKDAHDLDLAGIDRGQFGADIARFGSDKTVIMHNRGGKVRRVAELSKQDTMQTVGVIANAVRQMDGVTPVIVDVIGVGSGVVDRLNEQGFQVVAFNGAERAYDSTRFRNRRAETYWMLREWLEEGGMIDLDPEDDELAAQLQNMKYVVDSSGRIRIESKDDMRKRTKGKTPSPDRADALVLSLVQGPAMHVPDEITRFYQTDLTSDLLTRPM